MKNGELIRRVHWVHGGHITDYTGLRTATIADIQTFKLLFNAAVPEDAYFMTAAIHDFYLGSDLETPEYLWLTRNQVPPATLVTYGDAIVWLGDHTLVRINKGLYGLSQAGRLAKEKLISLLAGNGYNIPDNTGCLFRHETRVIAFALVVNDFVIKYEHRDYVEYLLAAIEQEYSLEADWSGSLFLRISINYSKDLKTLPFFMPGYVEYVLKRFGVSLGQSPIHAPMRYYSLTPRCCPPPP